MAPHFASALWSGFVSAPGRINKNYEQISWEDDVIHQKWPKVDCDHIFNLNCLVRMIKIYSSIIFNYKKLLYRLEFH